MKIQQPFLAVGLLFSGACLSKALKKETAVPQAPVENQPLEAADDPFACAKHEDCETDELCFVDTCVFPSLEMSCSLPEDSRLGQLSSGAEGGPLNTACVFMVDADGNGTEEILKVARDLNRSMIDIDIVDTDTLQLQHFEVSTENALFDSPHVRLEVIPKEFSGKPLLKLDVPGREACDSASYNYYLSYEPSKGIQIAIRTISVSGEVGSFESTATFSPDGTLQYREERELYESDTGIASAKSSAHTDPPPRRMCLKEGVYVDCPEGEAPITGTVE